MQTNNEILNGLIHRTVIEIETEAEPSDTERTLRRAAIWVLHLRLIAWAQTQRELKRIIEKPDKSGEDIGNAWKARSALVANRWQITAILNLYHVLKGTSKPRTLHGRKEYRKQCAYKIAVARTEESLKGWVAAHLDQAEAAE